MWPSAVAKSSSVGILGIGVYLPEAVRDNSWWTPEITSSWGVPPAPTGVDSMSRDEQLAVAAMERHRTDLFQGSRHRHVMADGQSAIELEVLAGQRALADAGVTAADIDLLLTHSSVPDYLCTNTSCSVHERLGLPRRCFSLSVEAASNAFLMQAALAEQAIRTGAARCALLVQSCAFTRILPRAAPYSPWLGDGASAVVVGPVAEDVGFLAWEHRADGSIENTFIAGVPGKHWYDEGRVIGYPANPPAARRMFQSLIAYAKDVCPATLTRAQVAPEQVDFYASHQGTAWFREATQAALGLSRARFVDTWEDTASVYSSNIPLCLHMGRQNGSLSRGDTTLMFSGGGGTTYTCGVMKWSV